MELNKSQNEKCENTRYTIKSGKIEIKCANHPVCIDIQKIQKELMYKIMHKNMCFYMLLQTKYMFYPY